MKSFIVNFDTIRNESDSLENTPVGFIANAVVKGELIDHVFEVGEDPEPALKITVPGFADYLSVLTETDITALSVEFDAVTESDVLYIHASGENPK